MEIQITYRKLSIKATLTSAAALALLSWLATWFL